MKLLISIFVIVLCGGNHVYGKVLVESDEVTAQNDMPIVGVLAQEISYHLSQHFDEYTSFIAASYVKFVEGGGARVVPIWYVNLHFVYYHNYKLLIILP